MYPASTPQPKFVEDIQRNWNDGGSNTPQQRHGVHDLFSPNHAFFGYVVSYHQDVVNTEARIVDHETNASLD